MNQSQRNFLIERIEKLGKIKRDALEKSIPQKPSLNLYLFKEVMSGNVNIISNEKIIELIEDKALISNDNGDDWLGNAWQRSSKEHINFLIKDFFIIPDEYRAKFDRYKKEKDTILERIRQLIIEEDTVITRIKLASNSTLENMIKEVDDMGNLSLMDTKLRQLTN